MGVDVQNFVAATIDAADLKIPIGFLNDLGNAQTEGAIAQVYSRWAMLITNADRCAIALENAPGMLCVTTTSGQRVNTKGVSYPVDETLLGEAFRARKTLVVTGLAHQPYAGCRVLAAAGMDTLVIAPIVAEDDCFGVISGSYRNDQLHGPEDQALLQALAGCLGTHLMLRRQVATLEGLVRTDRMTGAYNRHYYEERVEVMWADWQRTGRPFSIVSVDLDHFKLVNDNMGHAVGDIVLCETVNRLTQNVRAGDAVVRMGGEEFCVLMSGLSRQSALPLVTRLHSVINAAPINTSDGIVAVTASMGIASAEYDDGGHADTLKRSDSALYAAKSAGRNRIVSQDCAAFEQAQLRARASAKEKGRPTATFQDL